MPAGSWLGAAEISNLSFGAIHKIGDHLGGLLARDASLAIRGIAAAPRTAARSKPSLGKIGPTMS
jgi:hypothetical protein